jgi:uncharacterized protein
MNPAPERRAFIVQADGSHRPADHYDAPLLMADAAPVQFHVMAKPAGAACNLDCTYCFYLSKEKISDGPGQGIMSDEVLEAFIRQYIADTTSDEVVFTWQGGEPMLRGLDFYRRVVELQSRYAKRGQRIENDLQTNGVLLDDAWCEFLKAQRFLVGLSIDGPRELHDRCRPSKRGRPTFDEVMRGARLLQRYGIPFNTLTCVHRYNARFPIDIYRFLRDELGSTRMQFTPVVEFRGFDRHSIRGATSAAPQANDPRARPSHPVSIVTEWSVDPDDWGYFLNRVFDRWVGRDVGKIFVNQFDALLAQQCSQPAQMCVYAEHCGKGVAVEHDGSLYSCDHYVYPDYRLGDIRHTRLRDMVLSRAQVQFGYAKSESLPGECRACPWLAQCWVECPKNRLLSSKDGEAGLNYLCRGLKAFYAHAMPEVRRIAAELQAKHGSQRL